MLDFRIETFLILCDTMSYTKTASILHMTQPAVTQHIKHLEKYFECNLVSYSGKKLAITEKGLFLMELLLPLRANSIKIKELMKSPNQEQKVIRIGATKTIGDYVIPKTIALYLKENNNVRIDLSVDNTKNLLNKLKCSEFDFLILEGYFNKSNYDYEKFKPERFIAVASPGFKASNNGTTLEKLMDSQLFVREYGSGTRDVLEKVLLERNYSLENFRTYSEVSNFEAIKEFVKAGLGITFLYEPAVKKELMDGTLLEICINGFDVERDFNFVLLKGSIMREEYGQFFQYCRKRPAD